MKELIYLFYIENYSLLPNYNLMAYLHDRWIKLFYSELPLTLLYIGAWNLYRPLSDEYIIKHLIYYIHILLVKISMGKGVSMF